jgi:hypothetical protein
LQPARYRINAIVLTRQPVWIGAIGWSPKRSQAVRRVAGGCDRPPRRVFRRNRELVVGR